MHAQYTHKHTHTIPTGPFVACLPLSFLARYKQASPQGRWTREERGKISEVGGWDRGPGERGGRENGRGSRDVGPREGKNDGEKRNKGAADVESRDRGDVGDGKKEMGR